MGHLQPQYSFVYIYKYGNRSVYTHMMNTNACIYDATTVYFTYCVSTNQNIAETIFYDYNYVT